MSGTMDKMKGSVKETVGHATGDTKLETEGKTDKMKGEAKQATRDVQDAAHGVKDSLKKD